MPNENQENIIETIKCSVCGEVFLETEEKIEFNGKTYHASCLNEVSSFCDRCGKRFLDDDYESYVNDDDTILCMDCYEGYYSRCDNCDRITHNEDMGIEGICLYCEEQEQEESPRIKYRKPELKNENLNEFQDTEKGEIITSPRTFGVEIEMFHQNSRPLAELSKEIDNEFGVGNDGSISGGYGVEIQTPILKGKKGEDKLKKFLTKARDLGFSVNSSCGMHTHLGADDYFCKKKLNGFYSYENTNYYPHYNFVFIKSKEDSLTIKKKKILLYCLPFVNEIDESLSKGGIPRGYIGKAIIGNDEENHFSKFGYKEINNDIVSELKKYPLEEGEKWYLLPSKVMDMGSPFHLITRRTIDAEKVFFLSLEDERQWERTKTLLYFYTAFSDVILSMLHKSRWDNRYCMKLSSGFCTRDIDKVQSQDELEELWYKTSQKMEIIRRKEGRYDESRYFGLNLHSLFCGNGTIEIRFHSSTLNEKKILFWVALHQAILDNTLVITEREYTTIRSGITIDKIKEVEKILLLEDKIKFFFELLQIKGDMKEYFISRIKHFTGIDLKKEHAELETEELQDK